QCSNAAPNRKRHEHLLGNAADDIQKYFTTFMACTDVEEHKLVGPFVLIATSNFHRITGVSKVQKIDSFDYPPAVNVQTGYDALGQHDSRSDECSTKRGLKWRVRPLTRIHLLYGVT